VGGQGWQWKHDSGVERATGMLERPHHWEGRNGRGPASFLWLRNARPRFALFLETLLSAFAKPSRTHDGSPCEHLLTAAHPACVPAFAILTRDVQVTSEALRLVTRHFVGPCQSLSRCDKRAIARHDRLPSDMLPSCSATAPGGHRRLGIRRTAFLPFYSPTTSSRALPDYVVLTRSARNPATRLARVGAPLSQPTRTPFHPLRVIAKLLTHWLLALPQPVCSNRSRTEYGTTGYQKPAPSRSSPQLPGIPRGYRLRGPAAFMNFALERTAPLPAQCQA
jgi:hypothetical protein